MSDPVAPQVTRTSAPEPEDFTLGALGRAIWRNFVLVLVLAGLGGGGGFYLSTKVQDNYQATAALIFDTELADILSTDPTGTARIDFQAAAATAVETINSQVVIREAFLRLPDPTIAALTTESNVDARIEADRMERDSDAADTGTADVRPPTPAEIAASRDQELMTYLSQNLEVRNNGRSFLIEVIYHARDPDTSANVANAVAVAYMDYRLSIRRGVYRQILTGIDDEINQLKSELLDAERTAQIMRDQVRINAERTELLTGGQRDSSIAAGADLYAKQREAERAADSAAEVFERLLLNGRNIETRLGVPDLDVQLFSSAVPAIRPSGLDIRPVVIVLGVLVGFMLGCSIAVTRRKTTHA